MSNTTQLLQTMLISAIDSQLQNCARVMELSKKEDDMQKQKVIAFTSIGYLTMLRCSDGISQENKIKTDRLEDVATKIVVRTHQ